MPRRHLSGFVSFLCLIGLTAVTQAQELPPDIAASKTIRVALNSGYPPMETKDPNTGEFAGFDIDLMAEMAKVLGLKVEYQDGAFEAMTPALQSGRVDVIMSGFYDTPKRRPMFTFIDYLKAGAQFYTLKTLPDIQTLMDLCGKTITTSRGTSYPQTVKDWSDKNCTPAGKGEITVIIDTDLGQQLTNLKTGRAVAAVQGLEAVPTIVQMDPNLYRPLGEPFSTALMGMAFQPEATMLRDAFAYALKKTIDDGAYDALIKKWKLDLSAYKEVTFDAGPQP
ncbi:MAG: ABC transporter substrate-binding protein [Rhizobiales bacterium]|nr:ABC transporter substrate-binding protein [Hyphomicrobiales bacterium]